MGDWMNVDVIRDFQKACGQTNMEKIPRETTKPDATH